MNAYYFFTAKAARCFWLLLAILGLAIPRPALAVGSWKPLANFPAEGVGHMHLMSDGTVMAQGGGGAGTNWFRLTPDTNGSYLTGQWSSMTPMHDTRRYYSSDVLQDGRVFVAGGEYGTGYDKAEGYDPIATNWTPIPINGLVSTATNLGAQGEHFNGFADSLSVLLSTGQVLITPVTPVPLGETVLFDPQSNTLLEGAILPFGDSSADEQSAVKLPDDSILTFDSDFDGERYIPSQGQWIEDQNLPTQLFSSSGEVGAGFLLPDGRAFFLGGTGLTIYYTPSGNTNLGGWKPGPNIPGGLMAQDTPAAMMNNGKILCAFAIGSNHHTNYFYEFDSATGTFTQTSGPNSPTTDTNYVLSDATSMLDLPDGTVLYSDTGGQLYDYKPDAAPLASGMPVITSIAYNTDGSLHISGLIFNGISQGASFGDDNQMDSNYPLVRFTDGSGHVTYGRTYNWSSTSVQTGSKIVTTECAVPANIFNSQGVYSMQVVANGNASSPVTFYGPVWVDFNYTGSTTDGGFATPVKTLAAGTNAVFNGGTIAINASVQPSSSHETMKIAKPMTIISVYGSSTIGN